MRVIVISTLLFLTNFCSQPYNDLIDFVFSGKIKKVMLVEYLNPYDSSGHPNRFSYDWC